MITDVYAMGRVNCPHELEDAVRSWILYSAGLDTALYLSYDKATVI